MPTKASAGKKAAPAKAAAKSTKKAAPAEDNGNGRSRGVDVALAKKVAKMRDNDQSWADIAAELEISAGKAMLLNMYARVDDDDRITGNETQIAKAVVKERKAGYSWGALMARTGMGEARLRKMYEEQTGESTKGNRIGKGGRYPGDVNPNDEGSPPPAKKAASKKAAATATKAAPAKKATKAAKAGKAQGAEKPPPVSENPNHPMVDWSLDQIKARLDGRTIKVARENDRIEDIKVVKVKKKSKDGVLDLIDDTGKTRSILAVQIKSASK